MFLIWFKAFLDPHYVDEQYLLGKPLKFPFNHFMTDTNPLFFDYLLLFTSNLIFTWQKSRRIGFLMLRLWPHFLFEQHLPSPTSSQSFTRAKGKANLTLGYSSKVDR